MINRVVSLLNDQIDTAVLIKGKVKEKVDLQPFIWKNEQFIFDEPVDDDLVFDKIHLKFNLDFENNVKMEFLNCFIQEIFFKNTNSDDTSTLILIPTHFPEWAVQEFKNICMQKGIRQVILVRAAFLSVIAQYLADNKILDDQDYKSKINSQCKKNKNHWTLTHTDDEKLQFDDVLPLLELFFQNSKDPWPAEWPVELGVYDASQNWHTLVAADQETPYQRYFFFEMKGLQEATSLILLAKTENDFNIEILRIELPENDLISNVKYKLKLDFNYSWNGELTLNKGTTVMQKIPAHLPFLTYHI